MDEIITKFLYHLLKDHIRFASSNVSEKHVKIDAVDQ